ncbi:MULTISPECIES: hypothetical protein [Sediminimonas]|uniref:hypothetical protein n=1 Tax=Sediminimonas TaxID=659427 RepID=UPI00040AC3E1|nr:MULTISPECIES: hypothetical protein [Sediminimonas]MDR9484049.1 hypothetical protein [Sediminimonas sp.]
MSTGTHRYKTGLVFAASHDIDSVAVINRIGMILEARQTRVTGKRILSDEQAQIDAKNIEVTINTEDGDADHDDSLRLIISVTAHDCSSSSDDDQALRLLAAVTLDLVQHMMPESLWWLTPTAELSREQFLSAAGPRRPRRVRHSRTRKAALRPTHAGATAHVSQSSERAGVVRFPSVEESLEQLDARMSEQLSPQEQDHVSTRESTSQENTLREVFLTDSENPDAAGADLFEQPNQVQRLTTWMLTITVGVFSLPVAAALVVINLLRGEDMRLSAQALSLTGFFIVLNSSGLLQQATTLLTL